jgi:D-lactate dehydrogenase
VRAGLAVAQPVPGPVLRATTRALRTVLPQDWLPELSGDLPGPGPARHPRHADPADVVFFPACINSMFGSDGPGVTAGFLRLADAAGIRVRIPDGIDGLCCGTVWSSKGLPAGHDAMAARTAAALRAATDDGRLPVVADAASCTHGLHDLVEPGGPLDGIEVLDVVTYVRRHMLDRLAGRFAEPLRTVVVHPTCSTTHLDTTDDLVAVTAAVAKQVVVPRAWGCCGFSGDRGLLHPELTAAATAPEAGEVATIDADAWVSANRTCELGMTRATGRTYEHAVELLASRLR